MKNTLRKIYRFCFPKIHVTHSSQTIYQALLASIHMYKSTKEKYWLNEAKEIKNLMINIQQEDGGWDIGYYFNFGYDHNKGESTSPELLSLVALIKYWEIDNDSKTEESIQKGIDWIIKNSYKINNDWVIPYGPYSTKDVVVYNGISFAQAPLAMWSKYEKNLERKQKIIEIYRGMNSYLEKHIIYTDNGGYMKYSIPRDNMTKKQIEKIDYYHLAQQAEMHYYANKYCQDDNAEIIYKSFVKYLYYLYKTHQLIPYVNNDLFNNEIHVWGYSSTINAFTNIYEQSNDIKYKEAALYTKIWLLKHSLNKNYFLPKVSEKGKPIDTNYYPRSDAWVLNSLSISYYNLDKKDSDKRIILDCYKNLKNNNYSGLENHAGTKVRRFISRYILSNLKNLLRSNKNV